MANKRETHNGVLLLVSQLVQVKVGDSKILTELATQQSLQ